MYQEYERAPVMYKTVELRAKAVHAVVAIPVEHTTELRVGQIKRMDISTDSYTDQYRRELMLRMHAEIYGTAVERLEVPTSWWQFFKETHFPKWLLEKYPVAYNIIDIDVILPEIKHSGERYVIRAFDNSDSPYRY